MILHGKEIEVQVDDIEPFVNDEYVGFKILWSGSLGFGEYTIYKLVNDDKWYADDECMENPKGDRTFLNILFKKFSEEIETLLYPTMNGVKNKKFV